MARKYGLHALVVVALSALFTVVSSGSALADQNPRAAAFSRAQQINSRKLVLEQQLVRLKTQLATKRAFAAPLRARLESPEYALANAPDERAKLLDQAADALRAVANVTSKIVANLREDVALEAELGEIVATAQRDAGAATLDKTPRGALLARNKKAYVLALKTRSKALPPRAAEAKRARMEETIDRFQAQESETVQLIGRLDTELRFASVSPTAPAESTVSPPLKTCKMRTIDWPNVTITVAGQSMKLVDGKGTLSTPQGAAGAQVAVKQVDFADSNLDGREEALLLIERDQPAAAGKRQKQDVLYVIESALDCSLRRRAAHALPPGGTGKALRGGYDYTDSAGSVHNLRWSAGRLADSVTEPLGQQATR